MRTCVSVLIATIGFIPALVALYGVILGTLGLQGRLADASLEVNRDGAIMCFTIAVVSIVITIALWCAAIKIAHRQSPNAHSADTSSGHHS